MLWLRKEIDSLINDSQWSKSFSFHSFFRLFSEHPIVILFHYWFWIVLKVSHPSLWEVTNIVTKSAIEFFSLICGEDATLFVIVKSHDPKYIFETFNFPFLWTSFANDLLLKSEKIFNGKRLWNRILSDVIDECSTVYWKYVNNK